MYRPKAKRCILPLLLVIALLFPAAAWAASPPAAFEGAAAVELERNIPAFKAEDFAAEESVKYSALDSLGRAGAATACVSRASLPTEPRADSVSKLPVGWVTARYEDENGESRYLYCLCHVLSPTLGGDASSPENVFTGTRWLRDEGMRPFEDKIADYITRTENHVLYRVTPVYEGSDPVPFGVQLEARSVEDAGRGISFNVFVYNIQPGVSIEYSTGESVDDFETVVTVSAKALLDEHNAPLPSPMVAPQHASFLALSGESGTAATASAVPQNAPSAYVPQTVYIPDNGRYDQTYHSTASCGGMEDMAEREFDAVKRLYAPCAVCWVTPEYNFLLSVYYGRAVAEVRQQTQSQAGSAGADNHIALGNKKENPFSKCMENLSSVKI